MNLEQAENLVKRHEAFLTTMEANDDKINGVVQFAGRLCDEGHFAGMSWLCAVSYTHLDVYKRQHTHTHFKK